MEMHLKTPLATRVHLGSAMQSYDQQFDRKYSIYLPGYGYENICFKIKSASVSAQWDNEIIHTWR